LIAFLVQVIFQINNVGDEIKPRAGLHIENHRGFARKTTGISFVVIFINLDFFLFPANQHLQQNHRIRRLPLDTDVHLIIEKIRIQPGNLRLPCGIGD